MIAMQDQLTLSADYDMGIIRERVARTGHMLDRFKGLGQKAYLIRENAVDGSPVNQYAPFHLWADAAAAASFLWAAALASLCRTSAARGADLDRRHLSGRTGARGAAI